MARHIMAVCVVCLLCADRIPCQQHFDGATAATRKSPTISGMEPLVADDTSYNYQVNKIAAAPKTLRESSRKSSVARNQHRQKRHIGHGMENPTQKRPEITEKFLRRLFDEYGDADGSTIHINEFRRMLKQLGLNQLLEQRLSSTSNNDTCTSDVSLVEYVKPHDLQHRHEDLMHHVECHSNSSNKPCNGVQHDHDSDTNEASSYAIGEQEVLNLCPILLYQLSSHSEIERSGCIRSTVLSGVSNFEGSVSVAEKEDIMYVWIYAFISVFACGILGLVGVAIIPFMDSRFYKHIIQFLVSLAVGTMTGDALLHLLPHSLAGQSESNMIFKGLTCMSGIVFFYITEHGLTMISEWRKSIAKQVTKKPSRAKVLRDPDSSINNSVAGDKLCKSKYSSYPYCYDEIAMDTKKDVWMHLPHNSDGNDSIGNHTLNNTEKRRKSKEAGGILLNEANETAQSLLSTSHNHYAPISELNHNSHADYNNHNHHQQTLDNTMSTTLDDHSIADGAVAATNGNDNGHKENGVMNNDTVTVILREHESSHHGHSHKHGHVHSPPESLSAVAWMIIMGDGLHNFTDGMAIGAAFAENIAGGFSTSLAVFCHELPHELGDFAILMKAGMSVKSAVYYNLLTGVLSFIGMIFGIVFGQSQETAQWMFAAAAGLFIYIALVDMMPELSAAHKSLQQFVLQILGMSSGVLIMLLIAVFEGDLMEAFSSSPTVPLPLGRNHVQ